MFRRTHKTTTDPAQFRDEATIDEIIETKIKACQRENGRCMGSTSRRLRKKYGDDNVDRVLRRLSARRYRGNKYQEKGSNEIVNFLKELAKTRDGLTTQSSFEL